MHDPNHDYDQEYDQAHDQDLDQACDQNHDDHDHNQKGSSKLQLYVYEFDEDNCMENLEKQLAILIFDLIDGHWTTCAENHQPAPSGGHW